MEVDKKAIGAAIKAHIARLGASEKADGAHPGEAAKASESRLGKDLGESAWRGLRRVGLEKYF